jgi:hypothetical protein
MKVIFLDFDGVLAPYNKRYEPKKFSKAPVESLNKILKAVPEAKIVVSSTWRHHGMKYVKDMLTDNGIDASRVCGLTAEDKPHKRIHHIEEYLKDHKDIEKFVIIDDDYRIDALKDHWVKPSQFIGLTSKEADEAIELLK